MITFDLVQLKEALEGSIADIKTAEDIENLRLKYLGRKQGILTLVFKQFAELSVEEKRQLGPNLQRLKVLIENALEEAAKKLVSKETGVAGIVKNKLSAKLPKLGHLHPITRTIRDMNEFFIRMGFSLFDGPEIETDEFNFQRLNVPENHVARDMQDTIYIKQPTWVLRTQASSVEARALATLKPPFRIVSPGRVYRNEKANKSNHFVFHHYQGVVVGEGVTLSDLFGTLKLLFQHLYGENVVLRFRSKYYPEVEPGVGPDMQCFSCHGRGCPICKNRGWIEMAGAGMIHEKVFKMAGIDTKKYSGFAFGLGLDRWVMAKYGITDIRALLGGKVAYPYFECEKIF